MIIQIKYDDLDLQIHGDCNLEEAYSEFKIFSVMHCGYNIEPLMDCNILEQIKDMCYDQIDKFK